MAMFAAMCLLLRRLAGRLAPGLATRQYWLVLLGYGVLGGIGWGIGYISPVSTLMKWFPDKPGHGDRLAIMGFGGGALIASPWSTAMLGAFGTDWPASPRHSWCTALVVRRVHVVGLASDPGARERTGSRTAGPRRR